jgi:hypothetical protein
VNTHFKINKLLVIPLVLNAILFFALFCISIIGRGSTFETIILIIGFVPLTLISLELLFREIRIDDAGITFKKFLREKCISWNEVTHVGSVSLSNKVYLVLTTTKGFQTISNAYSDFMLCVRGIISHVEKDRIEENVAGWIERPVRRTLDIVLSWIAVVIIAGIIYIKLVG